MGRVTGGALMSGDRLEISAETEGSSCRPLSISLSPRQCMNFAAGLSDNNPWYFDDTRPEGILAHPMLAVALTWPLSADLEGAWEGGGIAPEVQARQVHYNESILWHRSMDADTHLDITGTISALASHPSGTLATIRYDARNRRGEALFTEYVTGLLRGVSLTGTERVHLDMPRPAAAPANLGGAWETVIEVGPLAAHVYDACSNISFPIHTSPAFARQVGLPATIYQGTATLGLALREILNREGDADPRVLAELHGAFRGMVVPGSAVTLSILGIGLESGRKTVYFEVKTAAGELAVRDGRAVLNLTT
jgi:acyl dehydratase